VQEVRNMSFHRKQLIDAVNNVPEAYIERVLRMIEVWAEPPTHKEEIHEWKKSLKTESYDLSQEEKEQMECTEKVSWEDVKKSIERDGE